MEEIWQRFVVNIAHRLDGPLHFRILLQPVMAVLFAAIDGWKDAKFGRSFYLLTLVTKPKQGGALLKDGWKHFGKIFILAIILDVVYQIIVHRAFYPMETLLVAVVLAILPYVLLRGVVNRIARLFMKRNREADHARDAHPSGVRHDGEPH